MNILTNIEMYTRTIGGQYQSEHDKWALNSWNKLYQFSQEHHLIENDFDGKIESKFHECFWELCLPKVFYDKGMSLNRKEASPDFYFEKDGAKVWLEAIACGMAVTENETPPPTEDFEGGISPDGQIMKTLATSLDVKSNKFKKYRVKGMVFEKDCCIIALNGYRAMDNYPHDAFFPPAILKTLFGIGRGFLRNGQVIYESTDRTEKTDVQMAHFSNPENEFISGVLYSKTSLWQFNSESMSKDDFIFIQNPYAKDITSYFNFCGSRWIREEAGSGDFIYKKLVL